jgi:1,2-diacylglycerol 3-alpha-glucosyltransferase
MVANVLIYSPGLGYINRGLESFTRELYEALKGHHVNLTLFQGRGDVLKGAKSVWTPRRNSEFYNLKFMNYFQQRSYKIENIVFSIPLILHCYSKPCDIIHFSEAIPANILYHLRKRLGGSFKLLFSNGGPALPQHYSRYDYVQVLTPAQRQEAIQFGYPESRLFTIPYGVHCQSFSKNLASEEVATKRQQWNLPIDRTVILCVGAVNSSHKRMDWMIQEFSKLDPVKFFLWIVGQPEAETEAVKDLAKYLLKPNSYQFDVISYTEMPNVYAIADYFALCSLSEGFGKVYIEAMAAGLPVIAHRNPNTEWILNLDNLGLVDMTVPDGLKNKILYFEQHTRSKNWQKNLNKSTVYKNFDWESLYPQYLSMYEHILT